MLPFGITPPPRAAVARHTGANKENGAPSSPSSLKAEAREEVSPVRTPTKTVPGQLLMPCQHHVEVKNTFVHYNSPVKTVSVVSPPKTVPSNFAPELLLVDSHSASIRTPSPTLQAATPSPTNQPSGMMPMPFFPVVAPEVPAPSTLLRLSDFLPPSSEQFLAFGGHRSSGPPTQVQGHCEAIPPGVLQAWSNFDAQGNCKMPQVPPLPGPPPNAYGFPHYDGHEVPPPPLNYLADVRRGDLQFLPSGHVEPPLGPSMMTSHHQDSSAQHHRVSISVGHFPEPGPAAPPLLSFHPYLPMMPPHVPQLSQLPVQTIPQPPQQPPTMAQLEQAIQA